MAVRNASGPRHRRPPALQIAESGKGRLVSRSNSELLIAVEGADRHAPVFSNNSYQLLSDVLEVVVLPQKIDAILPEGTGAFPVASVRLVRQQGRKRKGYALILVPVLVWSLHLDSERCWQSGARPCEELTLGFLLARLRSEEYRGPEAIVGLAPISGILEHTLPGRGLLASTFLALTDPALRRDGGV